MPAAAPLDFLPPRLDQRVLNLARLLLPSWLRYGSGISAVHVRHGERLVAAMQAFQTGEQRLLLAFRHPSTTDPLCLAALLWRELPRLSRSLGVRLRQAPHSFFLYDRGIPLWAGPQVGWLLQRLGGSSIQRGRLDTAGLRSARELLLHGRYPFAAAPEGGTNGHNEVISPLEPGIAQLALRDLADAVGDRMVIMSDLCVDEYTDHGHCGILDGPAGDPNTSVDNDATLDIYGRIAIAQAEAGAQMVAPSGMMDGQVGAIRSALDGAGHRNVGILAYSAKYASGLYGPFRDAVDCAIRGGGDRKAYQQDWRNAREALVEVEADLAEGADMVMVKPALAYLDIIAKVRAAVNVPLAAYHVSGEYSMLKAAAANGWIDHDVVATEHLTAIKRAGADVILTYLTRWYAEANA